MRETAHDIIAVLIALEIVHNPDLTQSISLNFFIGRHRTVLDAGFALKTHGSLVNGFTPLRAAVAGFFFSFMFKQPPSLKPPFFLSSDAARSRRPVTTVLTCLGLSSVLVARAFTTPLWVSAPPAFMAFIA